MAVSGVVGGLAAASASPAVPPGHAVGTVHGQLIQDGGPYVPGNSGLVPVPGDVTLTNVATGVQYKVHVTTKGYSIEVPAGRYNVVGLSSADIADSDRMGASGTVVVRAGHSALENLYIQIR